MKSGCIIIHVSKSEAFETCFAYSEGIVESSMLKVLVPIGRFEMRKRLGVQVNDGNAALTDFERISQLH